MIHSNKARYMELVERSKQLERIVIGTSDAWFIWLCNTLGPQEVGHVRLMWMTWLDDTQQLPDAWFERITDEEDWATLRLVLRGVTRMREERSDLKWDDMFVWVNLLVGILEEYELVLAELLSLSTH